MIQWLGNWRISSGSGTATYSLPFSNDPIGGALTAPSTRGVALAGGMLRHLRVDLVVPPGVGNSRTFVVVVNGSDTAITVTISDTAVTATDAVNFAAITKYDTFHLKETTSGTPAVTRQSSSLEFDTDGPNVSVYGGGGVQFVVSSTDVFRNPFNPRPENWNVDITAHCQLMDVAGAITELAGMYQTALVSGEAYELSLYRGTAPGSLVRQDGSGGTVDTRVTVNDSSTVIDTRSFGTSLFSLPVSPGDFVAVACKKVSGASDLRMMPLLRFEATTAGEFPIGVTFPASLGTFDRYIALGGELDGTEANVRMTVGPLTTPLQITGKRWIVDVAPGGATTRTSVLRKNGADTDIAITLTTGASGQDSGNATFLDGDTLDIKESTTGGPAAVTRSYWAMSGFASRERSRFRWY